MPIERFVAAPALATLKVFQRRTVDYVFDRFYGVLNPTKRFLVADEVGLGKTMVARGVIARTIEHLWDTTDRIDILYICSNQVIAKQNINRLNVLGRPELALPTRMTLIPLEVTGDRRLDANKVNFVSLTPGTTFDLRSATGVIPERALILRMLNGLVSRPRGLHNLLQVNAGTDGWNWAVKELTLDGVDQRIIDRFRHDVRIDNDLFQELESTYEKFSRRRDTYPPELTQPRNRLIARLRGKLSHACVDALKPDLIIMDEFQRFRELLHGDSDAAILARELFEYSGGNGHSARSLLLSATPYRMLTLSGDNPDEGEHYQDLLETVAFLYGREKGEDVAAALASEMRAFRGFLHGLPEARPAVIEARSRVEERLRQVMARTERVSSTVDRDSMVSEPPVPISVEPADLRQAAAVSEVARLLDAPEITEYWKSAPYLLNFMRDYALKRLMKEKLRATPSGLREAIARAKPSLLDSDLLDAYEQLEPANGRMRGLMDNVFRERLEQHLWIPPALPYYGPPRADPPLTKALVFSSWSMVPDAIAALLSYEAERLMGVGKAGQTYFERTRPRPLQFRQDQGRLAGMRAMLLIYPSPKLAELTDPLTIFAEHSEPLSLQDMRAAIAVRLRLTLDLLRTQASGDTDGQGWEWAAPVAIDAASVGNAPTWLHSATGLASLAREEGFQEHVTELRTAVTRRHFGPIPDSITDLLVDVALGSPAVCALRALHRVAPELGWDDPQLLQAASRVAWGFRTLFNQHDAVALLRRDETDPYWRRVLTYGAEHNLQAVLDEYVHYLVEAEGLGVRSPADRVAGLAKSMAEALSVRPSQIDVDDPAIKNGALTIGKFQMRGRFAMRLSDYRDEEGTVARLGGVRDAFNSPFRPFVLATTSVGQEGLDFHPYCYRVYHWNLPGNPVDLEQREGRVHRYKGHAIRLNLAQAQADVVRGCGPAPSDPWKTMFDAARAQTTLDTDLVPYWLYEGPVKVERRVPMLPFSREVKRLEWLKRSLTVYRLAFGQPRQDDLLDYLRTLIGKDIAIGDLLDLQIRLDPRAEASA
jgi:hypothetical protein